MEILRIPNRYGRQLSRLTPEKRLWIYDSLMAISAGENVELIDDIEGDIFELIWRDCLMMERKNGKNSTKNVGRVLNKTNAGDPAGESHPEVKGSEVKGNEGKRKEGKCEGKIGGEKISPTPSQEMEKFLETISDKERKYIDLLLKYRSKYSISEREVREQLDKFVAYWTEPNKTGKKVRWQMEKTWDVRRRLVTWFTKYCEWSGKTSNLKYSK